MGNLQRARLPASWPHVPQRLQVGACSGLAAADMLIMTVFCQEESSASACNCIAAPPWLQGASQQAHWCKFQSWWRQGGQGTQRKTPLLSVAVPSKGGQHHISAALQTNDATFSKFESIHAGDRYEDAQTR